MPEIILTEEQARIIAGARGPVEVRGPQGELFASIELLDPGDIEAIERYKRNRSKRQPGIPSAQVQAFLRKLQEIADREGIDEAKAQDLLRRVRAGEAFWRTWRRSGCNRRIARRSPPRKRKSTDS
jgi:hypothetical protein